MENKKWFAMGLVGIFTAIGGVICIFTGLLLIRITNNLMNSSLERTILMVYVIYALGYGTSFTLLLLEYSSFIRYRNMIAVFSIPLYIGICLCVAGGILAITGWIKYYQLEHGK